MPWTETRTRQQKPWKDYRVYWETPIQEVGFATPDADGVKMNISHEFSHEVRTYWSSANISDAFAQRFCSVLPEKRAAGEWDIHTLCCYAAVAHLPSFPSFAVFFSINLLWHALSRKFKLKVVSGRVWMGRFRFPQLTTRSQSHFPFNFFLCSLFLPQY